MSYDAFISYSHAADGELAPALQNAVQRLAKPWYRRRALEVFRDETGLAVDPNLWGAIVNALEDAEWFVLLTSPTAAGSEWVNREIEHWKANRPLDRILPIVTDGHWEWDPDTGDFTDDSDAVPPSLRGVFHDEPRHLDLRWARDETQLNLRNSRFRGAAAEVAAPLHGRTKDDLEGEDIRQHRRTLRLAWGAAVALVLLTMAAVMGAGIAVRNADQAQQRRIEADAQRLVAQTQTELERPDLALLLAAHAHRLDPSVDTAGAVLSSVATLPEMRQRIRTEHPVTAVAESDAEGLVWAGDRTGALTAYRFDTGEEVAVNEEVFDDEVLDIITTTDRTGTSIVATDGVTVATLGPDLEVETARPLTDPVFAIAVQDTTGRIAGGTVTGELLIWEPDEVEPSTTLSPPDGGAEDPVVSALAWGPNGSLIVAHTDGTVRRLDPSDPARPVWELDDPTTLNSWVEALAVVPDGPLVTGGTDGSVGFWDPADGSLTEAGLTTLHADAVTGLAYTGDPAESGSVTSVAEDGFLLYWNDQTGSAVLKPLRVDEAAASAVAWDPAYSLRGATAGSAGGVLLLDYSAEQRQRRLARPQAGWDDATRSALAPDGSRLAVATSEPRLVMTSPDEPGPDDHSIDLDGVVEHMVFTPDSRVLVAGLGDGTVITWDGETDAPTVTELHRGPPSGLAVSPDGRTVASRELEGDRPGSDVSSIRLSRIDETGLEPHTEFEAPSFGFGLAYSPDGQTLASGGLGAFTLHDVESGETREISLDGDGVRSLAIDATGEMLAIGLDSGPVRFYDIETGEPVGDELRHAGEVTALAFHDDSRILATVSEDGGFHLWNVERRRRLSSSPLTAVDRDQAPGVPLGTALTIVGDEAFTSSLVDGRLLRWSLAVSDWIAEGCDLHDRELTAEEEERFGLVDAAPVCRQ